VSYRTSDPLHAVIGVALGLFGVAASVVAAGSWWYTLNRETTFEMVAVSAIPTVIGLGLIGFAGWVFVDIARVRREERDSGHTSRS
jgi:hypothetical protein